MRHTVAALVVPRVERVLVLTQHGGLITPLLCR
jgi:hypothetical protein